MSSQDSADERESTAGYFRRHVFESGAAIIDSSSIQSYLRGLRRVTSSMKRGRDHL